MVVIDIIICNKCIFFRKSTIRRSFQFGFLCVNMGLAYLLKGNVVMMLYLCSRASSAGMSPLWLIAAGRLWL